MKLLSKVQKDWEIEKELQELQIFYVICASNR